MFDGVLREGFLKIALKTKAFPTTAIGEKRPTTAEVYIKNALTVVAILRRLVNFPLVTVQKSLKVGQLNLKEVVASNEKVLCGAE